MPKADAILAGRMDKRALMAGVYLRGNGLEVGGLHNPLSVPHNINVRYVDYVTHKELQRQYPDLQPNCPDIVDDGVKLASISDDSQDFLIACQVIEHTENPIEAFKNWLRVLKAGGILFVSFPDRRFTFDYYRSVTSLAHLLEVHQRGSDPWRDRHFEETYRDIIGVQDEELVRFYGARKRDVIGHTHFHVWTQLEMLEFILTLRRALDFDFEVEAFCASGNEGIFVLRKGTREDFALAQSSLRDIRAAFDAAPAHLK